MAYESNPFVLESSYKPMSMQEMLTPFLYYKQAYDEAEEKYDKIADDAGIFKYLEERLKDNPDSEAAQIYKKYMDDFNAQARDFSINGLSMANRSALSNLRKRYKSEIGLLERANNLLETERKYRRELAAKDPSMLYEVDDRDLNIDNYLYDKSPSNYSISGDSLYAKGATYAQMASKRMFKTREGGKNTLGGYYIDYIQENGITPEMLAKFGSEIRADFTKKVSVLPEFQEQVNNILKATGASDHLSGSALERARAQVINGMIDGSVYTETHSLQRDLGKLTAAEQVEKEANDFARNIAGYRKEGNTWVYNEAYDEELKKQNAIAAAKYGGKSAGGAGSDYGAHPKKRIMVGADTGKIYRYRDDDTTQDGLPIESLSEMELIDPLDENNGIESVSKNPYISNIIAGGNIHNFIVGRIPKGKTIIDGSDWFSDDATTEDIYVLEPKDIKKGSDWNNDETSETPK